jgi:hypothetical protein
MAAKQILQGVKRAVPRLETGLDRAGGRSGSSLRCGGFPLKLIQDHHVVEIELTGVMAELFDIFAHH